MVFSGACFFVATIDGEILDSHQSIEYRKSNVYVDMPERDTALKKVVLFLKTDFLWGYFV